MIPTCLFVYGTLRHDQPEHRRYCRGVTGWSHARLDGRLFRLPEGYRIIVLPRERVLGWATADAAADEGARCRLAREVGKHGWAGAGRWIAGEMIEFEDAGTAWPPIDRWEGFEPGRPGTYQRVMTSVEILKEDGAQPTAAVVWVYAALETPRGVVPVDEE